MRHLGVVGVKDLFRALTAGEESLEGTAKLDRHGVVEDRVDGRVHVHHEPAEEDEPVVCVALAGKRVVNDKYPIWHPKKSKHSNYHCQHFDHL